MSITLHTVMTETACLSHVDTSRQPVSYTVHYAPSVMTTGADFNFQPEPGGEEARIENADIPRLDDL